MNRRDLRGNPQPTRYTVEDRARMAAALKRSEEENARRLRNARLARLVLVCVSVALTVAMFYSFTGGMG